MDIRRQLIEFCGGPHLCTAGFSFAPEDAAVSQARTGGGEDLRRSPELAEPQKVFRGLELLRRLEKYYAAKLYKDAAERRQAGLETGRSTQRR